MRLSVLDQSGTTAGRSPDAAIRDSLALAVACEKLGYQRYWVSEHHNNDAVAGSAPEVLLGALAAVTTTMRIGSAGVMLPHYAPLKVAEQFRVIEALAPGRVDLGLGRGPGADRQTSYALKPGAMDNLLAMAGGGDSFASDVADVVAWSSGSTLPDDHPFAGVRAQPSGPTAPQPWLLGSTPFTAGLAGHMGLPYCFAHFFHDGEGCAEVLRTYRESFKPGAQGASPIISLCVWAVAAPTPAEAEDLFLPYAHWRLDRDRLRHTPFPGATEVASRKLSTKDSERIAELRDATIFGTAEEVTRRLDNLSKAFDVDEIVVVTMTHDPAARLRSYQLIAAKAGLAATFDWRPDRRIAGATAWRPNA